MGLKPKTIYQTISMEFPSEKANDGEIRVSFALDVKNDTAIGLSGGGIWKGLDLIGSFDGFVGFAHNVTGADKEAVDEVLHDLSEALTEEYNVPPVVVPELEPEPEPEEEQQPEQEEEQVQEQEQEGGENNSGEGE